MTNLELLQTRLRETRASLWVVAIYVALYSFGYGLDTGINLTLHLLGE